MSNQSKKSILTDWFIRTNQSQMNGTGLHVARLYHLSDMSSLHGFGGSRVSCRRTHTRTNIRMSPFICPSRKINTAKAWEWDRWGDSECNAAAVNELIEIAAYTWSLHQIILMSSNGLSGMKRKVSQNHYWTSTQVFHHFQHNGDGVKMMLGAEKEIHRQKSKQNGWCEENECAKREKESWVIGGASTKEHTERLWFTFIMITHIYSIYPLKNVSVTSNVKLYVVF